MNDKENKLILYKDDEGRVSVNVRFADENVWLTRESLAEIYSITPQNISLHVGNIYQDKELDEMGTRKKFFLVRQEGKRHYAEFQALEQNSMTMADWFKALDDQILRLRKNILEGAGTISHQEAIEKAEHEFEIYREREMRMLESDFDKAVKSLLNKKHEDENDENT
jgi:hypothetical protein